MCQTSPGPRCASHARVRRNSLNKKVRAYNADIGDLEFNQEQAANNGEKFPKKEQKRLSVLRSRRQRDMEELRLAIRDYDGTKTGQRELNDKITSAGSQKDKNRLRKRRREGAMLRDWRKNAKARQDNDPTYSFKDVMLAA